MQKNIDEMLNRGEKLDHVSNISNVSISLIEDNVDLRLTLNE